MRNSVASGFPVRSWALRVAVVGVVVLAVGACSSTDAPSTFAPTDAVAVPTDDPLALPPALDPTSTSTAITYRPAIATPDASVSRFTPPSPLPPRTATPAPQLWAGMCTAAQLSLAVTSWVGTSGAATVDAHLTATNVSSSSCNMRGRDRAQIIDANGAVIADAGSAAARVLSTDPVYPLAPGGRVNTIVHWGNWCKPPAAQALAVALVAPYGLGRITAPAAGVAPIPGCTASGSATLVHSDSW